MIQWLLKETQEQECSIKGIINWKKYGKSAQFKEIRDYLQKQYDVFGVFNQSLEPIIKKKALDGIYDTDIRELLSGPLKKDTYVKYLSLFMKQIARSVSSRALVESNLLGGKNDWRLLFFCLKITFPEETFGGSDSNFDFKQFYECFEVIEEEAMLLQIEKMLIRLDQ